MEIRQNVKKMTKKLKIKSTIFSILLVVSTIQTANAQQWERVYGGASPGVVIIDELPWCWFSPSHYFSTPDTITLSHIQYDPMGRIIEYYASGTENGYPFETRVYDATYSNSGVTAFRENRYYPTSGNAYNIVVSGVTYNASGNVIDGYYVSVNFGNPPIPPEPPEPPKKATYPIPSNGATNQPVDIDLSWSNGGGATNFSVYFGIDPSPDSSEFMGGQTERTFDPGILLYGTTYYWRIDAWNAKGRTYGDIWSFTTIEGAIKKTIYVDDNASGANDGTSWENAYTFLQDALADADSSDKPIEIRVAQGVYKPDLGEKVLLGNRWEAFQLINGVTLRGSYAGLSDSDSNNRDIEVYDTILSGDLAGNDTDVNNIEDLTTEPTRAENSIHVVIGTGTNETAVLDGFSIIGGNANITNINSRGGGVYNDNGSLILTNCTFIRNSAGSGGGIHNRNNSSPVLTNCIFIDNHGGVGGGMYNRDSNPSLTDCTFSGNISRWGGVAYNFMNSNQTLTNCIFRNNSATEGDGGGIFNRHENVNLSLINCTFSSNFTSGDGGGICTGEYNNLSLTNCTFISNSAYYGGGIYNNRYNTLNLNNCTFRNNSAVSGGGIRAYYSSSSLMNCTFTENYGGGVGFVRGDATLTSCAFRKNSAGPGGGIIINRSRPSLKNCTFTENYASSSGGAAYILSSPLSLITNCIFIGNSSNGNGGGIHIYEDNEENHVITTNCTFFKNVALHGNALSCDSYYEDNPNNVELINCILWDDGNEIWNEDGSTIDINYSNIQGGQAGIHDPCETVIWDRGNIDIDPLFANLGYWVDSNDPNLIVEANDPNAVWIDGDYHLKSQAGRWDPESRSWIMDDVTSPCIDAGDPNSDWTAELWPHGRRINIGAYGGTPQASMSLNNVGNIADLDGDGFVGFADIEQFANRWLDIETLLAEDFDRDGAVNYGDFAIIGANWHDE